MLWLLTLHIIALAFWCASQFYLSALIAGGAGKGGMPQAPRHGESMPRFVFLYMTNPAALLTIISGTGVFLLNRIVTPWLFMKLYLVVVLVVLHALTGLLVLRSHDKPEKPVARWCALLAVLFFACMTMIMWVVLAKFSGAALPMGVSWPY